VNFIDLMKGSPSSSLSRSKSPDDSSNLFISVDTDLMFEASLYKNCYFRYEISGEVTSGSLNSFLVLSLKGD